MLKPSIQQKTLEKVNMLAVKLYGENGFEGDIPQIKKAITDAYQRSTSNSINIAKIKGYLIGVGVLGVSGAGVSLWQLLT